MKLVKRLGLDTIYGVDAYSMLLELRDERQADSTRTAKRDRIDEVTEGIAYGGEDKISQRYSEFYRYKDSLRVGKTLLESFKYFNSDKVLDRGFGAYLNGVFKAENHIGADALASNWMNRNLSIYNNIQQITADSDDRILVLFGSAHIQLLKFFFECSPEYELIPFEALENY